LGQKKAVGGNKRPMPEGHRISDFLASSALKKSYYSRKFKKFSIKRKLSSMAGVEDGKNGKRLKKREIRNQRLIAVGSALAFGKPEVHLGNPLIASLPGVKKEHPARRAVAWGPRYFLSKYSLNAQGGRGSNLRLYLREKAKSRHFKYVFQPKGRILFKYHKAERNDPRTEKSAAVFENIISDMEDIKYSEFQMPAMDSYLYFRREKRGSDDLEDNFFVQKRRFRVYKKGLKKELSAHQKTIKRPKIIQNNVQRPSYGVSQAKGNPPLIDLFVPADQTKVVRNSAPSVRGLVFLTTPFGDHSKPKKSHISSRLKRQQATPYNHRFFLSLRLNRAHTIQRRYVRGYWKFYQISKKFKFKQAAFGAQKISQKKATRLLGNAKQHGYYLVSMAGSFLTFTQA
jgi:hypothetical protein